eukprot:gene2681-3877_t
MKETILKMYYDAMNKGNLEETLKFLDSEVSVTFKEAERNWKGLKNATIKFSRMFELNPNFYGEILEFKEFKDGSISVFAFFGDENESKEKKLENKKEMFYRFTEELKIINIDH